MLNQLLHLERRCHIADIKRKWPSRMVSSNAKLSWLILDISKAERWNLASDCLVKALSAMPLLPAGISATNPSRMNSEASI